MTDLYDFEVRRINGEPLALSSLRGQVLLIVNTASQCGLTPQLAGLESLHQKYADQGLVVLGFPCNQFLHQDPASNQEIGAFCSRNYGVSFPMMAKIEVNGPNAAPLYQWLTQQAPGLFGSKAIKWNFTKFLIGKDGCVRQRYAPTVKPASIAKAIELTLKEAASDQA